MLKIFNKKQTFNILLLLVTMTFSIISFRYGKRVSFSVQDSLSNSKDLPYFIRESDDNCIIDFNKQIDGAEPHPMPKLPTLVTSGTFDEFNEGLRSMELAKPPVLRSLTKYKKYYWLHKIHNHHVLQVLYKLEKPWLFFDVAKTISVCTIYKDSSMYMSNDPEDHVSSTIMSFLCQCSSSYGSNYSTDPYVVKIGGCHRYSDLTSIEKMLAPVFVRYNFSNNPTFSPMLSSTDEEAAAWENINLILTKTADIKYIKYFVPYRDKALPQSLGTIPSTSLKGPVKRNEYAVVHDVPADGYCGSHSVNIQSDSNYFMDGEWSTIDDLLISSICVGQFTHSVCYDVDSNSYFIAKSPDAMKKGRKSKVCRILRHGSHFVQVDGFVTGRNRNSTLYCNWSISILEVSDLLPNMSMSALATTILNPTSHYDPLLIDLLENMITDCYPIRPISNKYMNLEIENNRGNAQRIACFKEYLSDPISTLNKNLKSLTYGAYQDVAEQPMFSRISRTPIVSIQDVFYRTSFMGDEMNCGIFIEMVPTGLTRVDIAEIEDLIVQGDIDDVSLLTEPKLEPVLSAKERFEIRSARSKSSDLSSKLSNIENTSKEFDYDRFPYKLRRGRMKTSISYFENLMSNMSEMLPLDGNPFRRMIDFMTSYGKSNFVDLMPSEQDYKEFISNFNVRNPMSSRELAASHLLLWFRGQFFEKLIKYHKGTDANETTFFEFLVELNSKKPEFSREIFRVGLSDVISKVDLESWLKDNFSGVTLKVMHNLLFDKTPDIMQVEKGKGWFSFIVCDPSSSSSPSSRHETKQTKYGNYAKLINPKPTSRFILEHPVVDHLGGNVLTELESCSRHLPTNQTLVTFTSTATRVMTACFSRLRQNYKDVLDDFKTQAIEVDMGVLVGIDYKSYLTERDKRIVGLNDSDLDKIFNLEYDMEYEKKSNHEALKDNFCEQVKISYLSPTANGSCSDERSDIHLDINKRNRLIQDCCDNIRKAKTEGSFRHDPMGYMPCPVSFNQSPHSGFTSCFDGLLDMRSSSCRVLRFLSVISNNIRNNPEACDALDGYPERHKLFNKYTKLQHKHKLDSLNRTLEGFKITSRNTLRVFGDNKMTWLAEQSVYKTARSNKDTLKGMEDSSIGRISKLIAEMEMKSSGSPQAAMAHLFATDDIFSMTDVERLRMTKYFSTKGSHFSACVSKMCFELNFLLSQNMNPSEISVSNLGLEDVVAIVMPGCRLTDSSTPRHVKFCIRGEILKGQGFMMTKVGDWYIQDGYSKITSKILTHMINMPMALAPYYNETYDKSDDAIDTSYKRALHQVYWMAGDTGTNKMLGVVRYLGLLIFSYVCDPVQLISAELSQTALKWRRDIHIYTIDQITKNLPALCSECSKLTTMQTDDGAMVLNQNVRFKRLLHGGHHNSFRDMLNEFYMYYTWNKTQTSSLEGQKKVFNKLLSAKYDCQDNINAAMEQASSNSEFQLIDMYLNTGIRIGFSKDYLHDMEKSMRHCLRVEKRTKMGMGFAPFLSLAAETWFDQTMASDILPGTFFQPLMQGVESISNTRGSLERTDLVDKDQPILTNSLKRLNKMDQLGAEKVKEFHKQLSAAKITREEYDNLVENSMNEETEDMPLPEIPEYRSIYDSSKEIFENNGRPSLTKRKITKLLKKSGYDVRSKCIVEVIKLIKEHVEDTTQGFHGSPLSLDTLISKFIRGSKDMLHGLSPKIQHLSARELRIMDILSKAGMKVVEDLARFLNKCDERETSASDKAKQKTQESNSREIDHFCKRHNHIPLKLSADKSKWGPSVLPVEMIPLLRIVGRRMPHLAEVVKLCIFMVIKLQSKRVLAPTELIAFWGTYKLDMSRLEKENPEVFRFLNEFDPSKRCTFDNISDMGQGIMNAFTSFKHLACTSLSDLLYDQSLPDKGPDLKKCQLSSDDSLEMVTFKNDKFFKSRLTVWLIVKNFSWRLCNIINNNKKTAGSLIFSEYNSNFNMAPFSTPPNIKQIISAASVQFDYSWTGTVKSKLSEIKAASETGVTSSTCRILNYVSKSFYESLFSIQKIKSIISLIDPYNEKKVVGAMSSGCIEFGRFPIVDPVSLSLFGMAETNVESLSNREQMNVLTNIEGNIFFETNDFEVETDDYNMNLLSIRSMRMRVHKIEQLESSRKKLFSNKDEMESLKLLVQERNPFYSLKRPMTFGEQYCSLYNTFMSSSMQQAYTNSTTTRGLMRLFGMKTSAGYGLKGSKTENCSFLTVMILMNMATVYDLRDIDLSRLNKKEQDDDFIQVNELKRLIGLCPKIADDDIMDLPSPLKVLKQISESNLGMLKNTRPDTHSFVEWNYSEPTLTRVPAWNNEYKTKERPIDILESMWFDDLPGSLKVSMDSLDVAIIKEKFGVKDTVDETVKEWGLDNSISSTTQVANWLCKMMKSTYKPSRLTYGRATTSQGMTRYMSDLYCYNEDTQISFDSNLLASDTPRKWNYSDSLYEYLSGLTYLTNCFTTVSSFKHVASMLKEGIQINDIELSRVVSDMGVAQDLRFVAAVVLKQNHLKEVDKSLNNLLLSSLSPRSHTYIVPQRDVKNKFVPDSNCSVLYSSRTGDCTVIKEEGRKIKVHINRDLINDSTITDNINSFLTTHFLTNMFSPDSGFNDKYRSLDSAKTKNAISYFSYDAEKKKWHKSTIFKKDSIPVCFIKEPAMKMNIRPNRKAQMVLDWNTKCFLVDPRDNIAKSFFSTQILMYHSSFLARPSTTAMCSLFRNSLLRSISESNKLEIIMAIGVFDDIALRGFSNDFSGASIAAADLIMSEEVLTFDRRKFNNFITDMVGFQSFKTSMELCDLNSNRAESDFRVYLNSQLGEMTLRNNSFANREFPKWAEGLTREHFNYKFSMSNIEIVQADISEYDEVQNDVFDALVPEQPIMLDLTQNDLLSEPASKRINSTRKRCVDKWKSKSVLLLPTTETSLSKVLANIHISQLVFNEAISEFSKLFNVKPDNKMPEKEPSYPNSKLNDEEFSKLERSVEKLNMVASIILESNRHIEQFNLRDMSFQLAEFLRESNRLVKVLSTSFDLSDVKEKNMDLSKRIRMNREMSTDLAVSLKVDPNDVETMQENGLETEIMIDELRYFLEEDEEGEEEEEAEEEEDTEGGKEGRVKEEEEWGLMSESESDY